MGDGPGAAECRDFRRCDTGAELRATRNRFTIVGHSRTGPDFVVRSSERDPDSWSTGWRRAR
ncbi:MAG TPA: hypothetical protein VG126_09350 [Thermoleophilaceae bacterium]|nr:hypothetical protein [Thermoleophilaceae bacterium]